MQRRFIKHGLRQVRDLAGAWDFAFLGDVNPDDVIPNDLVYSNWMAVPGCFDAMPAYAGKRGLAAYRLLVEFVEAVPHRLVFDSVHHWCRVFVNGNVLGEHMGGFSRFNFDFVPKIGTAEVVVLVDNRFDFQRCPLHLEHYDWYQFGGISRGVKLHRLGSLWIDELRVSTTSIHPPTIAIDISYGSIGTAETVPLQLTYDGQVLSKEIVEIRAASGHIERRLVLSDAALWSPEHPNLHQIHVQLGEDDCNERIGLRQIRIEGQQLLINDRQIPLIGFNRHEFYPPFGHALPEAIIQADIQQLRDLGCNFVRGSHYPQDERFLDLCDEAGICVWSESIGWQNTRQHLIDPGFINAQLNQIGEMVDAAANRPSVIMWGVLNEGHSHEAECRPAYAALLNRLRELDPTRPVTYASNQPHRDQCFDLADIISINTYPGWYWGTIGGIPKALDDLMVFLDAKVNPNKPILISEIGAGAIPGCRDWYNDRWTEQYQSDLLQAVIQHLFIDSARVCGLSIWLYNDFRTPDSVSRPRSYNDKGIVDEYRGLKMAYSTVKQILRNLPHRTNSKS